MILNLGIPESQYPALTGSESGRIAILGGARCVWDDYSKLCGRVIFDVMTVNDVTMHFPGEIRHAYSNSQRLLENWCRARRDQLTQKYGEIGFLHSLESWPWPGHGTSALGATYTALALGYDEILLCGVPLDGSGHYFDPVWVESNHDKENIQHWIKARDTVFEGKVTSMSGRTREILESG